MNINITVQYRNKSEELLFSYNRMFNAGFVGRNQEEARRHIYELAQKGIPGPKTIPTLYPIISRALVIDSEVEVFGTKTSGEVEYVLMVSDDREIYIGLGSDHTDRHLEETDIPRAKQICPNVLCKTVWPLDEVIEHWDSLIIRSWVKKNGEKIKYQEGRMALILNPPMLMDFVRSNINSPFEKVLIFSGTIGMMTCEFVFGEQFSAELIDEKLGRKLNLSYNIRPLMDGVVG